MSTDYNKPATNKPELKPENKIKVTDTEGKAKKESIFKRIASAIIDPSGISEIKVNLKDQVKSQSSDAIKTIISSGLKGAVDAMFYGNSSINRNNQRTNYNRYSGYNNQSTADQNPYHKRQRTRFNSKRYVINNRQDAESIITALTGQILEYRSASVADFYNLIDIMSEYTDNSYGWTNLDLARIESVPDGFVVVLPDPIQL